MVFFWFLGCTGMHFWCPGLDFGCPGLDFGCPGLNGLDLGCRGMDVACRGLDLGTKKVSKEGAGISGQQTPQRAGASYARFLVSKIASNLISSI